MTEKANRALAETIDGVRVEQTEEFVVIPAEGPDLSEASPAAAMDDWVAAAS